MRRNMGELQKLLNQIATLDRIKDNEKLIRLSDEGILLAKELHSTDIEACLKANKANFLLKKTLFLEYDKNNLVLCPGWFQFSIDSDKKQFEDISREIERIEREVDNLLSEALRIVDITGNDYYRAHILMIKGEIYSFRYQTCRSEYIVQNEKAKWLKYYLVKRFHLDRYIVYNTTQRETLNKFFHTFVNCYLDAADRFKDSTDRAIAYYNLANHYKTDYRFCGASRYLAIAENIAAKHHDQTLLAKIRMLSDRIKMKNRDIPNYVKDGIIIMDGAKLH